MMQISGQVTLLLSFRLETISVAKGCVLMITSGCSSSMCGKSW